MRLIIDKELMEGANCVSYLSVNAQSPQPSTAQGVTEGLSLCRFCAAFWALKSLFGPH